VALAQAQTLCHGFEKLGRELAEFRHGFRGQVRLWANMSALTEFLPDALASFMRRYPEVQIDVEEQPRNLIVTAVREGAADIGVIAGEVVDAELRLDPLYRDQLVLVCAREHPLARRRRVAFADTLDYEHIGLSHGTSLSDITIEAAQRAGRPLLLRMQARSFDAACQMIAATLRVGVLPRLACRSQIRNLGLRGITLTDPWAQRQFFAVVKVRSGLSAAARLLHEHLAAAGRTPA
jgi:DNA-binding transcriptional LysR family regulator